VVSKERALKVVEDLTRLKEVLSKIPLDMQEEDLRKVYMTLTLLKEIESDPLELIRLLNAILVRIVSLGVEVIGNALAGMSEEESTDKILAREVPEILKAFDVDAGTIN